MKHILFILILIISSYANVTISKMGILSSELFDDEKLASLVYKVVENRFNKKYENEKINLISYSNKDKLLKDFSSNKLDFIIATPYFLFENEKLLEKNLKNKFTLRLTNTEYEQYYLLKNSESDASLEKINNYKINFRDGIISSNIWFRTLVYEKLKMPYKNILKNEVTIIKRAKLVLSPFFDKKQLSIVNKFDYDFMLEINPQLKNKLKIMYVSAPIFLTVL